MVMTTLGISLGTRTLGYALSCDGTLVDWQVHNFKDQWSEGKLKRIVRMIERKAEKYQADHIVIKVPAEMKIKDGTALILEATQNSCLIEDIPLIITDILELKQHAQCRNKYNMMEYAMSKYEDINAVLGNRSRKQRNYYLPAVEAVVATEIIN